VTDFDDEDGYRGAAVLEAGGLRRDVQVELRGYFQPIDGRYHWYGRIAADPALAEALRGGRVQGTLTTPHRSVPAEVGDPDPWGRYRVEGTSTPPFRTLFAADQPSAALPRPAGEDPAAHGPDGLPRHVGSP
jgi:hypothetical protein